MSTPISLRGTLPDPRLERMSVRQPGKATLVFVAEALEQDDRRVPAIPETGAKLLTDWLLIKKEARRTSDGYFILRWYYEAGLAEMPASPTDIREPSDRNFIYGMDATVSDVPLTMHPKIGEWLCTYGGSMQEGRLIWPTQDPTGKSKRSGYDTKGVYYGSINPFYGVESFLSPQAILQLTKITAGNSLPLKELSAIGYIDTPPDFPFTTQIPGDGSRANWIRGEAGAAQHGHDLELTTSWKSGGIGGWSKVIYEKETNSKGGI